MELFKQYKGFEPYQDEELSPKLWNRLEEKLDHRKRKKKLSIYRFVSAAAIILLMIACFSYFNHYLTKHNPELYVSNVANGSMVLEEISYDEGSDFFNVSFFGQINKAHGRDILFQFPGNQLGVYKSIEGELSFEITKINSNIILQVSSSNATFYLSSIENDQYTFIDEMEKVIRIRINNDLLSTEHTSQSSIESPSILRKISSI